MEPSIKVCPECGVNMEGLDPFAHALTHWLEVLDFAKSSKEARTRQAQTLAGGVSQAEYKKSHPEVI